jgi:uncharacterized protein (DUF2342 family)
MFPCSLVYPAISSATDKADDLIPIINAFVPVRRTTHPRHFGRIGWIWERKISSVHMLNSQVRLDEPYFLGAERGRV